MATSRASRRVIGGPGSLQSPDVVLGLLEEVLERRQTHRVDVLVVARDLLDHSHDRRFLAVARHVQANRGSDLLHRGLIRPQRMIGNGDQPGLVHLGDLAEDLLLRIEVVVEGARGDVGLLRDVDDARLQEAVTFEDPLRRVHEPRSGTRSLRGTRRAALVAPVRRCRVSDVPHPIPFSNRGPTPSGSHSAPSCVSAREAETLANIR